MIRYFSLYGQFVKFSIGRALEFRADFYLRIIMDTIYYLVNFGFFKILYLHTNQVGGWSEPQAMIFVGCFLTVDAINMTLFSNNTWMLPQLINKGDLDYYLVRPISSFFMTNFREFAFNSFLNLIIAGGFLIYTISRYPDPFTFGRIFLFILILINGAWIFHLVRLLFLIPVFWTHTGRGFETMYWSLVKFGERPYGIYKGWLKVLLMTALPFIIMSSFPAEVLFQANPWPFVGISILCSACFFVTVLLVWRFCIRGYSSASS